MKTKSQACFWMEKELLFIKLGTYNSGYEAYGTVALDGELYHTVSINMPEGMNRLPTKDCMYVKDYSENAGIAAALVKAGYIEKIPNICASSGYIVADAYRVLKTDKAPA